MILQSFHMDVMDEGLLDFWRVLNKHQVAYIMVGGFAVNMNGFTRATDDSVLAEGHA